MASSVVLLALSHIFWVRKTPVMVPMRPEMAAKTSLFHLPKTIRCTISGL